MNAEHSHEAKVNWPELNDHYGPVAWCNFCSRKHPRRKHDLVLVERVAKSGRVVYRWAHPKGQS